MSQESVIIMAIIGIIVTIIGTGIALAAVIVPAIRELRKEMAAQGERTQRDIAALGDRTQKGHCRPGRARGQGGVRFG